MAEYSSSWYIFAVGLLSLITKSHLTAHENSHGYISSNERYFDDFSFIEREISSGLRSEYSGDNVKFQIKFDPATLDFRQRPLGFPHIQKVHLYNFDTNRSIDMTSISGSTVHFHSSFFQDKKIPPMGNTSFNVVFLGREEGYTESCLFIHTTNGHFKYNVKGVSIYSPYYLRPIVDVKLPVNATFEPLIYLHNPHSEPIQIVEVYTSGGDFHLELPTGEREGPKNIWEIAPFETKAVIRVKFSAKNEQNHTAYVRIRLNITEEILVIPLEIEVGVRGGIFSPQGYVDFGIGGSLDPPKKIKLCLYNPFTKPVKIQSISVQSKAIKIEHEQSVVIPTGKSKNGCTNVANLTLNWNEAFKRQDFTGKITVKYRNGRSIAEIPYFSTVLQGGVSYDADVTKYFVNNKSKSLLRHFKLKNEFKSTILILNVTYGEEIRQYFKIGNFKPLSLKEQEDAVIFSIDLKPSVKLSNLQLNSYIEIKTNVSNILIPVLSYKGTLKLYLPFKSKDYSLDLGLISFNTKKEVYFLVLNDNPVNIKLKGLKTSIPLTTTAIIGCNKDDRKNALLQLSFKNLRECNQLQPGEYAIVELVVQTENNEGHVWGEIQIETNYENLSVPVQFKVAVGKLEIGPDRLVFDQCFPGKICSHPLKVHSTFNEAMIIRNIASLPPDPRLSSKHSGHISAHTTKIVGHLYLNPNAACKNECYTGLHQDIYDQWLKTLMLPKSVVNFDLNLFNTFYNRFLNLTMNGYKKWQNLTLILDTSEVRNHMFKTRVKMSWPSLLQDNPDNNKSVITFPLTQIGNISYVNLTIRNPSSNNLIVQILLDKVYPSTELLYEGLPSASLPLYVASTRAESFFLARNLHRNNFFDTMNIKIHSGTVPLFLKPGENYTLSIAFHGDKVGEFSNFLLLRNNLTVIEVLRLQGKSAEPVFRFGNRRSGALQPLLFEFTDKHAKECDKDKHYKYQNPNIVVKRSFTARNMGEIPILVSNFYINDALCEGYGFKVLNCAPFILPENGTKKIDIEFTPDFTLAKVVRTLILKTSCNFNVNYTLQATVPSYYISACSNMVPRPFWESYLANISLILMCIVSASIFFVAIFDAEKIKKQMAEVVLASSPSSIQPVLDLRLLGQQVREEVQNTKLESANDLKNDIKCTSKSIQIGETYKVKPEPEKSSALIPTVGKAKKKLSKKNSTENSEYVEAPKKTETFKHKINNCSDKKDREEDKKSSHYNKENKKVINCKRLNRLLVEEEASSTTTESSTNTDEVLEAKENSQKYARLNVKKTIKIDNVTNVIEETSKDTKIAQKLDKKKTKNTLKTKENTDNKNQTNLSRTENKKKNSKEHKDKNVLCRKSSLEKSSPKIGEHLNVQTITPVTNVWTENRATFSDVVARNDNPSTNRTMLNKPTMYVEPYKQTNTALGPIGSKPVDFWQNGDCLLHHTQEQTENINSYFSNIRNVETQEISSIHNDSQCGDWGTMRDEKTFQYDIRGTGPNYNPSVQEYNILDPWNHNSLNSNTFWSSNNLLGNGTNTGNGLNSQGSPSPSNRQSSYLWGSSSVWQPWVPLDVPRTPTRTPPGFAVLPQNNIEGKESSQPQRTETYNPFTSGNIWTQEQNIWKYSKDS